MYNLYGSRPHPRRANPQKAKNVRFNDDNNNNNNNKQQQILLKIGK